MTTNLKQYRYKSIIYLRLLYLQKEMNIGQLIVVDRRKTLISFYSWETSINTIWRNVHHVLLSVHFRITLWKGKFRRFSFWEPCKGVRRVGRDKFSDPWGFQSFGCYSPFFLSLMYLCRNRLNWSTVIFVPSISCNSLTPGITCKTEIYTISRNWLLCDP